MKNLLRPGILILIILFVGLFLLKTRSESTNALIQATLANTRLSNPDAEIYAKNAGISVDEANRQFQISDTAGILQADLIANEADTFAGLWIEHSPEFKVVVLFTGNPRKTIKPYLEKEYMTKELAAVLDLRTAKVSLAELETTQEKLLSSLRDLRVRFELELNTMENNIKLGIGEDDKPSFDLAVQNGSLQVPDYVIVETIPQLGIMEPSLGDHFPQTINPPTAYLDLPLLQGKLLFEHGCLRVRPAKDLLGGDSFLLIWYSKFSTRTVNGVVQVIDSSTGEVLASVGDTIEMGDNGDTINPLKEPIPEECTGPYMAVGESIKKIDSPPSHGSSLPQLINTPGGYLDALISGELVVTHGCLRVDDKYGNNMLLVWPPGFSTRTEKGIIHVLDSTDKIVASVGDWIEVGGGEVPMPTYLGLVDPLPENCPGPYWLVGESIKKTDKP
jgi:hypothetical protein